MYEPMRDESRARSVESRPLRLGAGAASGYVDLQVVVAWLDDHAQSLPPPRPHSASHGTRSIFRPDLRNTSPRTAHT